jgi:plasmid stabilization system protein ParE
MRLILRPEAKRDFAEAAHWYETHAALGEDFIAAVTAVLDDIERFPERYPAPHTYHGPRNIHRALVRRFPYAVIYELLPDRARVAAIVHAKRHPDTWLNRIK